MLHRTAQVPDFNSSGKVQIVFKLYVSYIDSTEPIISY